MIGFTPRPLPESASARPVRRHAVAWLVAVTIFGALLVFNAAVTAGEIRADVGAAFAGYGANHGYSFSFAATPGPHTVCTYAINTGGGTNRFIMCRSVVA